MVLINPRSTKFGIFEHYIPLSVPIGLGYLAGYLQANNKEAIIIDEHVTPITKDLLRTIAGGFKPPYLFGISSLTACIHRGLEIAGAIKGIYPDSKVIFGGIHPTVLPEDVLFNENVDFVVKREGEEILNELYDAIKNKGDYSRIKGISYKSNGRIIHNQLADLPDLSKIANFPYNIFEKNIDKYNFGFIASSRGCPYDCIFCSQRSISGRQYRYVPTQVVIDEIDLLVNKYRQENITFVDDNFTANKHRVMELCEAMIKKGFSQKTSFDCQTRADAINSELLVLLKKAGFRLIDLGIETASERLMELLNKKESVQQNIDAVKLVKQHGFGVSGTFIFGLPTETRRERWQAYQLAKDLKLDYVRFNNATPYPGTKLYEIAKAENRLFIQNDWQNLNACGSLVQDGLTTSRLPYLPIGSDETTLKKDVIKANLFFSLRPNLILRLLLKRIGPAGWFYLPPKWYLRPREWMYLLKLSLRLLWVLIKVI